MLWAIKDLEDGAGMLKDLKNRRIYLLSRKTPFKRRLGQGNAVFNPALKLWVRGTIVEPYYPYEIDKEELKKRIADKSIDWEDPLSKPLIMKTSYTA